MQLFDRDASARKHLLRFCGLFGLLLTFGLLIPSSIPLGIPGEWVWPRLAAPADMVEWLDRGLQPLIAVLLVLGLAFVGDRVLHRCSQWGWSLLLLLLAAASIFWQYSALCAAPSPQSELRTLWVNYDPWATGYFLDAVQDGRSVTEFLAGFESEVARGDVLHRGTHPPGLPLLNRLLLAATRVLPGLSARLVGVAEGTAAVVSFRSLERQAGLARILGVPELAALLLLAALAALCCGFVPIFTALLMLQLHSRRVAWRAAVISVGLPAIAVFQPRSDTYYAASGLLLLLLTSYGLGTRWRWQSFAWGSLAGCWVFLCLLVSLVHLPILVAAGLWTIFVACGAVRERGRAVLCYWLGCSGLVGLLTFFGGLATGCRPWVVWTQNLTNHEGFYDQYARTWWKWLLVNPVELAFAAGCPLAMLGAVGAVGGIQRMVRRDSESLWPALSVALTATWLLLLFSGKNQGEAARLWIFITPWMVLAAAPLLTTSPETPDGSRRFDCSWLLLLVCQLVVCALTAGRVSGYLQF
jgi:hypothetical protein